MFDKKAALNILNIVFPDSVVKWIVDYDSDIFIALVLDKTINEDDQISPFYSFNKKTGEIVDYNIVDADQKTLTLKLKEIGVL